MNDGVGSISLWAVLIAKLVEMVIDDQGNRTVGLGHHNADQTPDTHRLDDR